MTDEIMRCPNCGRDLQRVDVSGAGPLARRFLTTLACDQCADEDSGGRSDEQLRAHRLATSNVPVGLGSTFEELSLEFKELAVNATREFASGSLALLALFGKGEHLPDKLAATAAIERLQEEHVHWIDASDSSDLKEVDKASRAPIVLADVDQGALLRTSMVEIFEIVAWRQRHQRPLLVTSNTPPQVLAKSAGEPFVRLLRRGKAITVRD